MSTVSMSTVSSPLRSFHGLCERALRRGGLLGEQLDQLGPRPYVELAVGAAQVEINRLRAEEEPRTDLLARQPVRSGERHLEFLRGQLVMRGRVTPPPKPLATRAQLGPWPGLPTASSRDARRSSAPRAAVRGLRA